MRVRVGRHQRQAALHRFAERHTDFYGLDPEAWAQEGLVDRILPWGVIFAACRRPTWTTTAAWSRGRRQSCGRTCNYGEEEGEPGWYNYGPEPYTNGAMPVWFWSMKDADKKLIAGDDWVPYLGGTIPAFRWAAGVLGAAAARRAHASGHQLAGHAHVR